MDMVENRVQMCGPGWGKRGGMNQEIGTDIYTRLRVKQITSGKLLYNTGSSAQCSVVVTYAVG